MFSGIIEEIGTITTITPCGDSCKLHITAATVTTDIHSGDSIAVNGICLTVVDHDPTGFTADVMKETLDRSVLGHVGDPVNLERALPVTLAATSSRGMSIPPPRSSTGKSANIGTRSVSACRRSSPNMW